MITSEGWSTVKVVKDVSRETLERLTVYHDLLEQWQRRINLIAPSTVGHIWERHIADSLQSCAAMGSCRSLVDFGSGAGFPGLVQAVLMADEGGGRVDLIETVGKKCSFMNAVIRQTGLKTAGVDVRVHQSRIEAVLAEIPVPEILSARALASLDRLFDYGEPFLTNGTIGVFPKGKGVEQEIGEARKHWKFDVESFPSRFETGSVILRIANLQRM